MAVSSKASRSGTHEIAMLTTGDLASMCGVTDRTIRNWIYDETIQPDEYTSGGQARFRQSTADRIVRLFRKRVV